jgi:acyl-CoA-dependent ceramide synthase
MGHGFQWDTRVEPTMWFLPFLLMWFVLRQLTKPLLLVVARWSGIKSKKVAEKFGYQLWLGTYYLCSTLLGIYGYRNEDWFQFPLGSAACDNAFRGHPEKTPTAFMDFAYQYQLGFYFAELIAIFIEPRRSDFAEYVAHHVATILLISLSSLSSHQRMGGFIFFIHDVPDIFICFAKCFHYMKREILVNVFFGTFLVTFVFFRLICLPSSTLCVTCYAPKFLDENYSYVFMMLVQCIGLQGLHIFWFVLILRMVVRLARGVKGDVRSDEDEDDEATKMVAKNKEVVVPTPPQ